MQTTTFNLKHSQTAVTIRPATPQDVYALLEMHARLSSDSLYSRYLRQYRPSYEELEELTRLSAAEGAAFVAVSEFPWETVIGFGYYLIDKGRQPKTAEPAFLIEDRFQGRGLGTALAHHLAEHARQNGIQILEAIVHQANEPMLNIFKRIGQMIKQSVSYGAVELSIQLEGRSTVPILERAVATAV